MTAELALYDPSAFRRVLVDRQETLTEIVDLLSHAEALGVDLEMVQRAERKPAGIQQWVHVLSLIQIASSDLSAVIDPLRIEELSPLRPLMGGPIRKVFLGGGQDAALLAKHGIAARNVVDVGEIALGIFGRREDGMAALSQRIFALSLDKSVRRADWSLRPINPTLLSYAHRDAELTLLIYRWLQQHFPEAVAAHERLELEPALHAGTPAWLTDAMRSGSVDVLVVLASHRVNVERDRAAVVEALAKALDTATSPRQINRLLRISSELRLNELLPAVAASATFPSSMVRASVARAIGSLAGPDTAAELLAPLLEDPIEEVRKAAEVALRDARSAEGQAATTADEAESPSPSLGDDSRAALEELMRRLEAGSG